tara:strand:+ start:303 stop:578 length:276 start_codon:yes stop_codon:yes gene_type:complete
MNQKHFTNKDSSVLISVMPVQRGNTMGVQVETRGASALSKGNLIHDKKPKSVQFMSYQDWNATAKKMQSAGYRMVNIDRSDNPNLINTQMI